MSYSNRQAAKKLDVRESDMTMLRQFCGAVARGRLSDPQVKAIEDYLNKTNRDKFPHRYEEPASRNTGEQPVITKEEKDELPEPADVEPVIEIDPDSIEMSGNDEFEELEPQGVLSKRRVIELVKEAYELGIHDAQQKIIDDEVTLDGLLRVV